MIISDENYKKIMALLKYGYDEANGMEMFIVVNNAYMLLGGEGNGEINELFIKEVMKKYE
jgi:hypothetical protein